eukprot:COSAG02_NODE_209_length_28965_cov_18.680143_14_plen_65_part_00
MIVGAVSGDCVGPAADAGVEKYMLCIVTHSLPGETTPTAGHALSTQCIPCQTAAHDQPQPVSVY